ncbi:MAG: zinc metallopeptidase [Bacilli bacterium]
MDYYMISYGLTFIAIIITLLAQLFISSSYSKYSKVKNSSGITGAEAARKILDKNGLSDVKVVETSGNLTDHYDPRTKVVRLSSNIYRNNSIASVSVAAHECGHAIQDKDGYTFMKIRSSLVPIVNFSSYAGYIAILLGCLFGSSNLIMIGILAECAILLFQFVTLPVEIDASKRALEEIKKEHLLENKEYSNGRTMLVAAASTYIASLAATLIEILRLILMFRSRDD